MRERRREGDEKKVRRSERIRGREDKKEGGEEEGKEDRKGVSERVSDE